MPEKRKLTPQQRLAATLTAENDLSDERIAEEVGISRTSLQNWRKYPEFKELVRDREEELDREMMRLPIARRRNRVEFLNDLKERLKTIMLERAVQMITDESAAGGKSGLINRQTKSVGYGKNAEIVTEYIFDAALSRELRAIDEQAAKELGQWNDKGELTISGTMLNITEVVIDRSNAGPETDEDDE